jgi:misacylated tRNA(Ala) deacylase
MTEWLYLTDSYLRQFEAEVIASSFAGVVLDRSAFYPRGGGQPSDRGRLVVESGEAYAVNDLRRDEDTTFHVLEGDARPAPGSIVRGELDWDRRYLLMRTHTALHMLSGVIFREFGAAVTGGNMEPGRGRLDFELAALHRDTTEAIEAMLNVEVEAARPIEVSILPREEAFAIPDLIRTKVNLIPEHVDRIRVVNIQGLDMQADGGTHVANTREVGVVKIVGYKSKGKINKRLKIALD